MLQMLNNADGSSGESDDAEVTTSSECQIPLCDLPPLPHRGKGYRTEPFMGICVVLVLSAMLVGLTSGMTVQGESDNWHGSIQIAMLALIWVEAGIAVLCLLYLLLGNAGVIHRSTTTCFPIPAEVEQRLRESQSLEGLKNISGPTGSQTLGTYCVRCLVWRPPKEDSKSHHCNTCQRCVVGFDHHCGVFGRCIVRGNMPCFFTLISMMFAGMVTAISAVVANAGEV